MFEYKVLKFDCCTPDDVIEKALNKLGTERFVVVNCVLAPDGNFGSDLVYTMCRTLPDAS